MIFKAMSVEEITKGECRDEKLGAQGHSDIRRRNQQR